MTDKAPASFLAFLFSLLDEASAGLPHVTHKRLFSCDALWANDNIYALVWKTGRLGLKIPDAALFAELMAMPGAEPWMPGEGHAMGHWVLLPETFHDDKDLLTEWTRRAHGLADAAPAAPKKSAKKKKA